MIDKKAAFLRLANSIIAEPRIPTGEKVINIFSTAMFFFGCDPDRTKDEWKTVMKDIIKALGGE